MHNKVNEMMGKAVSKTEQSGQGREGTYRISIFLLNIKMRHFEERRKHKTNDDYCCCVKERKNK